MQQQFHFIFPFSVVRKAKNKKKMHPTPQNIPLIKNRFHFTNREKAQSVHSFG
jgi:hypothetical protein